MCNNSKLFSRPYYLQNCLQTSGAPKITASEKCMCRLWIVKMNLFFIYIWQCIKYPMSLSPAERIRIAVGKKSPPAIENASQTLARKMQLYRHVLTVHSFTPTDNLSPLPIYSRNTHWNHLQTKTHRFPADHHHPLLENFMLLVSKIRHSRKIQGQNHCPKRERDGQTCCRLRTLVFLLLVPVSVC